VRALVDFSWLHLALGRPVFLGEHSSAVFSLCSDYGQDGLMIVQVSPAILASFCMHFPSHAYDMPYRGTASSPLHAERCEPNQPSKLEGNFIPLRLPHLHFPISSQQCIDSDRTMTRQKISRNVERERSIVTGVRRHSRGGSHASSQQCIEWTGLTGQ